jgi:hypothetical protein
MLINSKISIFLKFKGQGESKTIKDYKTVKEYKTIKTYKNVKEYRTMQEYRKMFNLVEFTYLGLLELLILLS